MKKCSKCGKVYALSNFYASKSSKDGKRSQCIKCCRQYYEFNKEVVLEYKKQYYKSNKEVIKSLRKDYYENNKDKVLEYKKKYQVDNKDLLAKRKTSYNMAYAHYDYYSTKLAIDDAPKLVSDGVTLEVRCRYCGTYFKPTRSAVHERLRALVSLDRGDMYFYCSTGCKKACPIYGQKKYPKDFKKATSREVQPELRHLVLERDDWTCQKCGKVVSVIELHCHHILPINESPIESADIDNCITLCKNCHRDVHKLPDCNYYNLRCKT